MLQSAAFTDADYGASGPRRHHNVLMTTKLLTVLEAYENEDLAIDGFVDRQDDAPDPILT
jgi:hypothetical protein